MHDDIQIPIDLDVGHTTFSFPSDPCLLGLSGGRVKV